MMEKNPIDEALEGDLVERIAAACPAGNTVWIGGDGVMSSNGKVTAEMEELGAEIRRLGENTRTGRRLTAYFTVGKSGRVIGSLNLVDLNPGAPDIIWEIDTASRNRRFIKMTPPVDVHLPSQSDLLLLVQDPEQILTHVRDGKGVEAGSAISNLGLKLVWTPKEQLRQSVAQIDLEFREAA